MSKEYISIKQFAEHLKKTIEETKELINTAPYSDYIYTVNNTILLDKDILNIIIVSDSQEIANDKPIDKAIDSEYIEHLNQEIQLLREQVKEKDKIITQLNQQLIDTLQRTQTLVDKALNTTTQAQILHANEKTSIFRRLFPSRKNKE